MFVAENLLLAVAKVLNLALTFYMWIIIARALVSWVNPDPYNPIVRFLVSVTEPLLSFIRRKLPIYLGGFDFSPVIAIFVIYFLQIFLVKSLVQLAARMG